MHEPKRRPAKCRGSLADLPSSRRAPSELAARLEQEWLAHLGSTVSPWSGLKLAVGCGWASFVIAAHARFHGIKRAPVAVMPLGCHVITLDDRRLTYLSLRPVTLFLIVELQAALVCGLVLPL